MPIGLQALRVNPLRTLLSTRGVIMGVGALVSVLAMSDGVERFSRDQMARTTDLLAVSVHPATDRRLDGISVPRTDTVRQIGVRKALGARNGDIRTQFLAESVAIASAGAALGTALGHGVSELAAWVMRVQTGGASASGDDAAHRAIRRTRQRERGDRVWDLPGAARGEAESD